MRSIGFFSTSLWPLCWKLVIHRIVHRATVKWLGEKRCDQHPAGYYEARRTLFQLQTKVNSQHGQHSQPLQQVDSASNVRDLPTFSISLRPGQCFFMHGTSSSAFLFRILWISTPIQSTPAKTNIEPENAPLKKENVSSFWKPSIFSFQPLTPQS